MPRSLPVQIILLLTGSLLVFQHIPIRHSDGGGHEHCIHCTGSYCVKDQCDCDHKKGTKGEHRTATPPPRTPVDEHRTASPPAGVPVNVDGHDHASRHRATPSRYGEASNGHGGASSHSHGAALSHSHEAAASHTHETAASKSHDATTATPGSIPDGPQIEPCGSDPGGAVVLSVDRYIVESTSSTTFGRDVRIAAALQTSPGEILADDIFHPPGARI